MTTPRTDLGVLIVGACQAGVQLAASLRDGGYTSPITLLGAEPHLPYQRPPLSKKALKDGIDPADLALRSEAWFRDQAIDLILDERVTELHRDENGAGTARTSAGRTLSFARLALAVGARPRRLDLPGADLSGIHYLRDIEDATSLRASLALGGRVVVVGGGFIGLEVGATAARLGCTVTVVLADDRLMARAVSPLVSQHFAETHAALGVEVVCSTVPTEFVGDSGRVSGLRLVDGTTLAADVVIVGVGATPRIDLAAQVGLEVEGGIVVDDRGLASDGTTLAVGDCAAWPVPHDGARRMRFESVNAATEQAKVAAATILGEPRPWSSAPWFWSDQFDLKLQAAGVIPAHGRTVVRRSSEDADGLTVLHFAEGDRLAAVECINRPADFMAARSAISAGRTIDAERASDPSISLKAIVMDRRSEAVA